MSDTRRRFTIEVCAICGGQLSSGFSGSGRGGSDPSTGRCGSNRAHWSAGGVLLDVVALPMAEQPRASGYPRDSERARLARALGEAAP